MGNTFLNMLLIPMTILSFSAPVAEAFSDVNSGNKYFVSVSYLEEAGIIQGYEDGKYRPEDPVNRAEALKMILLTTGITGNTTLTMPELRPFEDVDISSWFAPYVEFARANDIVNGNPDGNFEPKKNINLAETMKILLNSADPYAEYEVMPEFLFNDTAAEDWFSPYTSYAASKGIVNVYSTNTINPSQDMTRGYMAEVIYRWLKSKENGMDFGKATFYSGIPQGGVYTAAHKTLAFGTVVKVTNMSNGKTVDVTINDRGPWGPGRVIDLSSGAFTQLAPLSTGVITVQYEVISQP